RVGGGLSSLFHLNTIQQQLIHLATIFLKKEGFFKTFVVLVLRCRKIAKVQFFSPQVAIQ
ncbi:MAG TPA: hypothetical protein VMW10_11620, partial [Alphaproteobacteria bacterium]|nr:hypothetical protein [Alphaproteobacteria bacterium]